MRRAVRFAPAVWAVALAALMLGPALGVGYVLTFDMVWVPDLALRSDFLGVGTALPRAVPSDAVVAVLDQVVPGMLLQKVVLVGALVGGGIGAARLAGRSVVVRMVAVSVYVWSPFVIERLWIGQWPVLLCWAVLPWLVQAAVRFRVDGRLGTAIPLLLLVGSLSVNAGVMSGLVVLAVGLVRRRGPALRLVLAVVAANAPWVVAGLLHAGTATTIATSGLLTPRGGVAPGAADRPRPGRDLERVGGPEQPGQRGRLGRAGPLRRGRRRRRTHRCGVDSDAAPPERWSRSGWSASRSRCGPGRLPVRSRGGPSTSLAAGSCVTAPERWRSALR